MRETKLTQIFFVFLLTLAVFYPVSKFDFINFDDPTYVTENSQVLAGLTREGALWAFTSEHGAHWHPLAWISHMVDIELFGKDPGAHHLVSVFIHALNSVFLLLLLNLLFSSSPANLLIAVVFAIHPLRIESVVWISERKDVLSMFFSLAALITYVSYAKRRSIVSYLLVVAFLFLSLLSKPSAIILPILFLLLDYYPLNRIREISFVKLVIEKIPFLLACLLCALMAIWAQGEGGGLKSLADYPIDVRFDSICVGYLTYLAKFFAPLHLGIFYPFEVYQPGVGSAAFIGILAISYLVWSKKSKYPSLLFGWLWFLISLVLVIGFVQIGGQAYADRWSYLPHIGLLIGVINFWNAACSESLKKYNSILAILVTISLITWTRLQLPYWKNTESLFLHTIEISPRNFMAHTNLGHFYQSQEKYEEAAREYESAVAVAPQYPVPLTNLASVRALQERYDESLELLIKVLAMKPRDINALHNTGSVYYHKGQNLLALIYWLRAYSVSREAKPSKDSIYSLLEQLATRGCSMLETSNSKTLFTELRDFHNRWPFPTDTPMRLGIEAALKCQDSSD
ncbi:MAG: tetratricopeptide repeat protein [Deltaproteobacteria bacterium]|nr:tetratricopeptide repeat protein [Deltaproteobacteria bacterium]